MSDENACEESTKFLYMTRCKYVLGWRRRGYSRQTLSVARCSLRGEPGLKSRYKNYTYSPPRLGGSIRVRSRSCLQIINSAGDSNLTDGETNLTCGNRDSSRFVCCECKLLIGGLPKPTHSFSAVNATQEYLASTPTCVLVFRCNWWF